ncbi:hypothetical protein BH10PLA2_BH10PLA2_22240 [soil metagenome]
METMDILLWIVLPAFILGGGAALYFTLNKPKEDVASLFFRCPGCTRKIRYFKRQVGHRGMCSNCKTHWVFPVAPLKRD